MRDISQLRPGLPVIMLTSSSDLDNAVQAMRSGAWDFMVKHFDDDLHQRMGIVIRRAAERKLRIYREAELRAERDAFSVAAFTAQDALAILGDTGFVVFANAAFNNFCSHACKEKPETKIDSIVDIVAPHNKEVAIDIERALNESSAESLWSSELEISSQTQWRGRLLLLRTFT